MRVLVTGGSGVVGEGLIPHLLERGHHVRLLTRGANSAAREWPDEVESFAADVTEPQELLGAADGCDVVVHVTGIVAEQPPDVTFEKVNVQGTRNLLVECSRAGSPMFIYISSLAVERGQSAYHASKREAEALVRGYAGDWVILRPGNVFGPGDDVISQLLSMHRTLPAVPVVGAGDHRFQPIWYLDLGAAIAAAIEQHTSGAVYELSGDEVTTPNEILSHFEAITGRKPLRVPVPEFLASMTARVTEAAGLPFPINEGQFQMLIEGNVLRDPAHNALTGVFGVAPTPLTKALAILADAQPEQRPGEGVGGMERKKFWADITGSALSPEELMDQFRSRVTEVMPIEFDAEPGTPQQVVEGATLTAALPMRGNIQIRVVENEPRTVTFATLRGHPLAGVVRFTADHRDAGALRFTVSVYARAATMVDWLAMSTVGSVAQNSTWRTVVQRMVDISGGTAGSVDEEKDVCDETECAQVEAWIDEILTRQHRVEHERPIAEKQGA